MAAITDLTFPHAWQAEILPARPLILPNRHFIYPRDADEIERGALELLIHPLHLKSEERDPKRSPSAQDSAQDPAQNFLATCALGFRDSAVPTGIWSAPDPHEICAVSGGYAYLIDTTAPQRFTMIPYRPVLEIRPVPAQKLLLFVGHHSILAWGAGGQAWESPKLSDEGVTLTSVDNRNIHGRGWNMITDKELPFSVDLRSGSLSPHSN